MQLRTITKYTIIHFVITWVFWFLMLGVALGLGFKDDWSTFDQILSFVVKSAVHIMSFPTWWIAMQDLPNWAGWLLYPFQLLVSFVQVNVILLIYSFLKPSNKTIM